MGGEPVFHGLTIPLEHVFVLNSGDVITLRFLSLSQEKKSYKKVTLIFTIYSVFYTSTVRVFTCNYNVKFYVLSITSR